MSAPTDIAVAVIDDDESFCRSSSRWLHAAAFRAVTYHSAEEFLADPDHRRFSCLLVDVQLDGMSGLQLQRTLAARRTRLPIVFITAHDDPTAQAEAVRDGCVAYLRKTDDGQSVLEAIRKALSANAVVDEGG